MIFFIKKKDNYLKKNENLIIINQLPERRKQKTWID